MIKNIINKLVSKEYVLLEESYKDLLQKYKFLHERHLRYLDSEENKQKEQDRLKEILEKPTNDSLEVLYLLESIKGLDGMVTWNDIDQMNALVHNIRNRYWLQSIPSKPNENKNE